MGRPALHDVDAILDDARDLVLERGPRAAGVRAIAARCGAASGSLYHRFAGRDALLAAAWVRALERFQAGLLDALALPDALEAAAAGAAWTADFARRAPQDARLLLRHGPDDLMDGDPAPELLVRVDAGNERVATAVRELARRHFGSAPGADLERLCFAVVDLPHGAVRRHLEHGDVPASLPAALARSARDLLGEAS